MNFDAVTERIRSSTHLDFGSIFNRAIELFKKVWLQGFVTLLLTFVVILPFYVLFYIPFIAAGITDPEMMRTEELPPEVFIPMLILGPILMIAAMTISIALNAAFLRICRQKDLNENSREDYFFYLKKGYLGKSMTLALLVFGISILGMLACGVGLIYVMVPISIIPAFLAFDEELSPMEIVKAGFALGNKNWLVIFGLVFLMGILAELGILLCCVGILFTAMLSKIPAYFIYKDSIGISFNA
ncbi:hypothetical protein [Maribacter halichondriae]|uniref:hypothetical protein n=1 Tax=Maribacter halichondriae TaxID=2980554 RepID=UPI00235959D9|nr:hypothetical protein [Maribacter sp. Hal144]